VGGQERFLEAAMGTKVNRPERQNQKLLSIGWAAGIGITLVEMQFGMEYVLSHVAGHLSAIFHWLPMIGTLVSQVWK
jgi:hypothetical protein